VGQTADAPAAGPGSAGRRLVGRVTLGTACKGAAPKFRGMFRSGRCNPLNAITRGRSHDDRLPSGDDLAGRAHLARGGMRPTGDPVCREAEDETHRNRATSRKSGSTAARHVFMSRLKIKNKSQ